MEHHIELLARSPTKDFKFLLANVPDKYFNLVANELELENERKHLFDKTKSNKSTRKKHRKKQFTGVCSATLSYIKSLEELLLLVMEKKVGGCAHTTGMYFDSHTPQMFDMSAIEQQMLSSEIHYACTQRPDNMTDEDKSMMQYFIHKQIQSVDPQLCASLQLFAHKEAVAADPWTRQQRSSFPHVPAQLFTVPIATSMKQLSGGGLVCQNSMLPASPSILFPCCSGQAPCHMLPQELDLDCPDCNPGHLLQTPPPPLPVQQDGSATMPPPPPPPPPTLLPCCTDILPAALIPTADPVTIYSACARLCNASTTPPTSSSSSSSARCPTAADSGAGACSTETGSGGCCGSMSPLLPPPPSSSSLYPPCKQEPSTSSSSLSQLPGMSGGDGSGGGRVADVSHQSYQSAMEDLLLEGCDSPTESFRDFDTGLWNEKVPMDIDDIEVAQLAF